MRAPGARIEIVFSELYGILALPFRGNGTVPAPVFLREVEQPTNWLASIHELVGGFDDRAHFQRRNSDP